MADRKQYKKRPNFHMTAVQIDIEGPGIFYNKWGAEQHGKPGDWLVNNGGDIYTVENTYFKENYQEVSPGQFEKIGSVWAEVTTKDGSVPTLEGPSTYITGDYLVYDRQNGGAAYAVKKQHFERMYELMHEPINLSEHQTDYIDGRLARQIKWYDRKAGLNRINYYLWQTLTIVAAALVPIVATMSSGELELGNAFVGVNSLVAILGGASAICAAILTLYNFQENWVKYRTTCEDLRSHLAQYTIGVGIYQDKTSAFPLFAETCENIINAERGQWAQRNVTAAPNQAPEG
ncbi:Protein of unknown function [Alteromonadaceae bacterium Bs31]|nr:Protein of unknown function [Alteromonadaceae bacterium Bs31]